MCNQLASKQNKNDFLFEGGKWFAAKLSSHRPKFPTIIGFHRTTEPKHLIRWNIFSGKIRKDLLSFHKSIVFFPNYQRLLLKEINKFLNKKLRKYVPVYYWNVWQTSQTNRNRLNWKVLIRMTWQKITHIWSFKANKSKEKYNFNKLNRKRKK